jgi:hypothetical protein
MGFEGLKVKPSKQQWLLLKHSESFVSAVRAKAFSAEQNPGFELVEVKPDFFSGRFIERFEVMESANDPFGLMDDILTVRYVYFDFSVVQIKPGISLVKIVRPPASIKSFISLLSLAFGFSVVVKKVSFDLWGVYDSISSLKNVDRFSVPKAVASQIPISSSATAKVEITAAVDAVSDLKKTYGAAGIRLERFVMSARIAFSDEYLELSSAGSIYCTEGIGPILTSLINLDAFG